MAKKIFKLDGNEFAIDSVIIKIECVNVKGLGWTQIDSFESAINTGFNFVVTDTTCNKNMRGRNPGHITIRRIDPDRKGIVINQAESDKWKGSYITDPETYDKIREYQENIKQFQHELEKLMREGYGKPEP